MMSKSNPSQKSLEPTSDSTPIPNQFFSELLPAIDHFEELKLTLYALWAFEKREGNFKYLRKAEMLEDDLLLSALQQPNLTPEESLDDALDRAVVRGTLLRAGLTFTHGPEAFYFLNTQKGQAAVEAIKSGNWQPGEEPYTPLELRIERPNIFTLYEQNIGPLTPMIADTLRDAEATFSESWIEEAIRIAVDNNVRKWSYINAILEGWQSRGKDAREDREDSEKARRRYLKGWFDD
jgi:DnaD/phage-associated family protein